MVAYGSSDGRRGLRKNIVVITYITVLMNIFLERERSFLNVQRRSLGRTGI